MKFWMFLFLLTVSLRALPAGDALAEIGARLVRTEITEGRFRQEKRIKVLSKPLISTGRFVYHRNLGVIWQTQIPVESTLLINRAKVVSAEGEQALPPAFGRVFAGMLGGDLAAVQEGFEVSGNSGKDGWQLRLTPKDALLKKVIAGIELHGDRTFRAIAIEEANGNSTRIAFDAIVHPEALTPQQEADFARLASPR